MKNVIRNILRDIRVELGDQWDQNFNRQAFFTEAWTRRKGPIRRGRTILVDTGELRRSIRVGVTGESVTFWSDLPYAAIHNDGGEIEVTDRMRKFFWAMYYKSRPNRMKRGHESEESKWWKSLALKQVGSKLRIHRRQFLGMSREVEALVTGIIEENLSELDIKERGGNIVIE